MVQGLNRVPYYIFLWDDANTDHLTEHGITREDFEHVVLHARVGEMEPGRSSGMPTCRGFTPDGRFLFCVWEQIDEVYVHPLTACEIGGHA